MRPSRESLKVLAARQPVDISTWLVRGFLDTVRNVGDDPFAPHSFINLSAHPAEGIEDLYEAAPRPVRLAIRAGITMLGSYCRHSCPESAKLDDEQRLRLLTEFLRLSSNLICNPAAPIIAQIACDDAAHWDAKQFKEEIFPACCVCLQDLGLRFHESDFADAERDPRKEIKAALYRVVLSQFDPRYAPRTLAALINIAPEGLLEYLELLGEHVTTMHRQDPQQAEHSYLTAQRIVQKAMGALGAGFEKLQIAGKSARDAWLVQALFSPRGPLLHRRESPTCIVVAPRKDPNDQTTLTNQDLSRVPLPEDTLPLREGPLTSPDVGGTQPRDMQKRPRALQPPDPEFFNQSRKFPISLPRHRPT